MIQRAELLDLVLTDLYGERRLLRSGIVPPEMILSDPQFLRSCDGIRLPGEKQLIVVRHRPCPCRRRRWLALGHRAQAPSGAAYALENRRVLSRVFPQVFRNTGVQRLAPFVQALRSALLAAAPRRRRRSVDRDPVAGLAVRDRLRARIDRRTARLPTGAGLRLRASPGSGRPAHRRRLGPRPRHPATGRRRVLRPARAAFRLDARDTGSGRRLPSRHRQRGQHARVGHPRERRARRVSCRRSRDTSSEATCCWTRCRRGGAATPQVGRTCSPIWEHSSSARSRAHRLEHSIDTALASAAELDDLRRRIVARPDQWVGQERAHPGVDARARRRRRRASPDRAAFVRRRRRRLLRRACPVGSRGPHPAIPTGRSPTGPVPPRRTSGSSARLGSSGRVLGRPMDDLPDAHRRSGRFRRGQPSICSGSAGTPSGPRPRCA